MMKKLHTLEKVNLREIWKHEAHNFTQWLALEDNIRRVLKEETSIRPALNDLINMLFDGFDDVHYDWSNYMCGMGECCDPYAIGFVLPNSDYDDYIFK